MLTAAELAAYLGRPKVVPRYDLTAAELAVYLGLTASRVRHIVAFHGIQPVGQLGRAKLYDPKIVLEVTGRYDRRVSKRRGKLTAQARSTHTIPA